jgi:hypothetical protein
MLRPLATLILASGLLLGAPRPAHADFDVYCVSNGDGTTTCEGWRGGETLTCVGSRGGVSTCGTPSGRRFTCVVDLGGVTSCADNPSNRHDSDGTNCTFTGDGNFSCQPPRPRTAPLLPGPQLPPLTQPDDASPLITDPSVFGP